MNNYTNMLAAYGVTEARPGGKLITERILKEYPVNKYSTILEIGCGLGDTAVRLADQIGVNVTAIDHNPKMIEKAMRRHCEIKNITWTHGDLQSIDFQSESFHSIFAESVLSFTNLSTTLKKLHLLLKSSGLLFCLEPIYLAGLSEKELLEYKSFYGFQSLLTEEEWNHNFLKHGFKIKRKLKRDDISSLDQDLIFPELIMDEYLDKKHLETMTTHLNLTERYLLNFDYGYFVCEKI